MGGDAFGEEKVALAGSWCSGSRGGCGQRPVRGRRRHGAGACPAQVHRCGGGKSVSHFGCRGISPVPGVPDGLWPAWGPALANGVALFGGKRLGRGGRRDVWPPGSHGPVTPDFGNTHFVGRDSVISLESVPVCILVGMVLGFLSGLGVGGGSLLILWLTAVLSMEQRTAQGVNLLFFLPAAIAACLFHSRQGRLQWRVALPAMIAGSCMAGLCAWAATVLDTELLRKLFGCLLLATGLWELFGSHRQRKDR